MEKRASQLQKKIKKAERRIIILTMILVLMGSAQNNVVFAREATELEMALYQTIDKQTEVLKTEMAKAAKREAKTTQLPLQAQAKAEVSIEVPKVTATVEPTGKPTSKAAKAPEKIGTILVKASALNVRKTPNGTIIGEVGYEEEYDYYEEKDGWLKIKYKNQYGYVFARYGDTYDKKGNLLEAANIPTPTPQPTQPPQPEPVQEVQPTQQPQPQQVQEPQPTAPVQPAEPIQPTPAPTKDPATMSTSELCQWVVGQLITPDMDAFTRAKVINQYLCDHMEYDLNYYTTRDAILLGRGRCQGYANAYKNLMKAAGVETDYVRGYVYGANGTHAWNRLLINGTYYYVDVTWNDTTGRNNMYLLLSESEMYRDRQLIQYNPKSE